METHDSIKSILRTLGYKSFGSQSGRLKSRLLVEGIDIAGLQARSEIARRQNFKNFRKGAVTPDELIFCEGSTYANSGLRYLVLSRKLIPYTCALCPIVDSHNNLPLSLQLDHRNGQNNDHRLSNLRWLCPNCHSQTPTFAGKRRKLQALCKECGKPCGRRENKSGKCFNCAQFIRRKIEWPSVEAMTQMVQTAPTSKIAKNLGVSDVAVAKFCKVNGIKKPARGYWQKQRAAS